MSAHAAVHEPIDPFLGRQPSCLAMWFAERRLQAQLMMELTYEEWTREPPIARAELALIARFRNPLQRQPLLLSGPKSKPPQLPAVGSFW